MSIQLSERVTALERERDTALMAVDLLAQRVNALEAKIAVLIELNQRAKPGPKPKDGHV